MFTVALAFITAKYNHKFELTYIGTFVMDLIVIIGFFNR